MHSIITSLAARAVALAFSDVTARLPVTDRTIYLTFDDGPSRSSSDLLDVLRRHDAQATFFLRGDRMERHSAAVERLLGEDHSVANHSYGHLDAWRHRWEVVEEDLEHGERVIKSHTGLEPTWVRPPYGRLRPEMRSWCRTNGRRLALWDVMVNDFRRDLRHTSAAKSAATLLRPGSILVLHDGDEQQPHALAITEHVLGVLRNAGWAFEKLPEEVSNTGT